MDKYNLYLAFRTKILVANDPKTVEEFCEKTKITKKEIAEFISRPGFEDDLISAAMKNAKSKLPEIFRMVYKQIESSKSVADAERFVNMIKRIEEKDKGTSFTQNIINISDEKYRKILERESGRIFLASGTDSPTA